MGGRDTVGTSNQIDAEEEFSRIFEHLAPKIAHGREQAEDGVGLLELRPPSPAVQSAGIHRRHSICISWPSSQSGLQPEPTGRSFISSHGGARRSGNAHRSRLRSHSQLLPAGAAAAGDEGRKRSFDSFKTWSASVERQTSDHGAPPVDRYLDALEGPELDVLKQSEKAVLPEDEPWPFLLRFPISAFGICLGVGSQSILWKTLAAAQLLTTKLLKISPAVNVLLWFTTLLLTAAVSVTYAMKVIFYFEAVRREFRHPVRVNFFFAPWIACLFLFQGLPPSIHVDLRGGGAAATWCALMSPILCLELKIYGEWMSGGRRRLSRVANPSNHLSIVGNFVGALVGATVDLREGPIFFFAVGLAHYAVLFVTLYQRLPSNETLPRELHPVFFLFVAAPTVACVAWAELSGHFDSASRIAYFIGLFLYASLVVRINFFRGFRFSLAWWAYTFPMTGAAIATIRYAGEVTNPLTETLSLALSAMSTLTMAVLLISTVVHAVVLGDLFPNDVSIAIAESRPLDGKKKKKKKMKMNMKMKTSSVVFSPAAPLPPRPPPVEREAAVAIQIDER